MDLGGYDRKVIHYLKKEFGQELLDLGPHFYQAIPKNKQLTKIELITLCNYVFETSRKKRWQYALRSKKGKKAGYRQNWLRLSRLHEQVRRHGFDGIGDHSFKIWDSDQILVFNPSRVTPTSAHWLRADEDFTNFQISPTFSIEELKISLFVQKSPMMLTKLMID